MDLEPAKPTVYFDGACPLCRAEIRYYRGKDRAGGLCFVDVSQMGVRHLQALPENGRWHGSMFKPAMVGLFWVRQHSSKFGLICPDGAGPLGPHHCRVFWRF